MVISRGRCWRQRVGVCTGAVVIVGHAVGVEIRHVIPWTEDLRDGINRCRCPIFKQVTRQCVLENIPVVMVQDNEAAEGYIRVLEDV